MYSYGGFNVSVVPSFKPEVIPFLERGGIFAIANVRGGGELGAAWHQAGVRERKQNSFDDFNAAAEWLIAEGYTHRARLGAMGGATVASWSMPPRSSGLICGGPLSQGHRLLISRASTSPKAAGIASRTTAPPTTPTTSASCRHSPYHNMPNSIDAPAILMFVPDEDDRVAPWHGYKMLAQWQAANVSDRPSLLRGSPNAGHHGAASFDESLERNADLWSFLVWQLGVG